jgi:hypothetical protein
MEYVQGMKVTYSMNEMTYVFDILNTNLYKYMGKTRLLQVLYNNSINIVSCVHLF